MVGVLGWFAFLCVDASGSRPVQARDAEVIPASALRAMRSVEAEFTEQALWRYDDDKFARATTLLRDVTTSQLDRRLFTRNGQNRSPSQQRLLAWILFTRAGLDGSPTVREAAWGFTSSSEDAIRLAVNRFIASEPTAEWLDHAAVLVGQPSIELRVGAAMVVTRFAATRDLDAAQRRRVQDLARIIAWDKSPEVVVRGLSDLSEIQDAAIGDLLVERLDDSRTFSGYPWGEVSPDTTVGDVLEGRFLSWCSDTGVRPTLGSVEDTRSWWKRDRARIEAQVSARRNAWFAVSAPLGQWVRRDEHQMQFRINASSVRLADDKAYWFLSVDYMVRKVLAGGSRGITALPSPHGGMHHNVRTRVRLIAHDREAKRVRLWVWIDSYRSVK